MRVPLLINLALFASSSLVPQAVRGEQPQPVSLATHIQTPDSAIIDSKAVERIRKIVLHQGQSPRALANLVQLSRDLDAKTAAELYAELADDYLRQGDYDQAANVLQQLLNQHHTQAAARAGTLKLLQLYSSSEVNHSHQPTSASASALATGQQGFCRYALHVAGNALQNNRALRDDPAISFQRAVAARGANRAPVAKSNLTRLKHDATAGPWRACALVEQWLSDDRDSKPPKPVMICRRAAARPHLDGALAEPMWQSSQGIELTYDDEYLYLAVRYAKIAGTAYEPDSRPRAHDADLTAHDQLRLWLDIDRDYATCFELAVDHRGWTADRCWYDASWNPQWFVAAGNDDSTWTVEAAIAWEQVTHSPPQPGQAWAVAFQREQPSDDRQATRAPDAGTPPVESFSVLLFE